MLLIIFMKKTLLKNIFKSSILLNLFKFSFFICFEDNSKFENNSKGEVSIEKINFYENLIYNRYILPKVLKAENIENLNKDYIKDLFNESLKYLINEKDLDIKKKLNESFEENLKNLLKNINLIRESRLKDSLEKDLFKYLTFKKTEDYILAKSIPPKENEYENFFKNIEEEKKIVNLLIKDEILLKNLVSILNEAKKEDQKYFFNIKNFIKVNLNTIKIYANSLSLKLLSPSPLCLLSIFKKKLNKKLKLAVSSYYLTNTLSFLHNFYINKNRVFQKIKNIKNINLLINKKIKESSEDDKNIKNYILNKKEKIKVNLYNFNFTNFLKFIINTFLSKDTLIEEIKKINNFLNLKKDSLFLIDSLVAKALLIKNNNNYSVPEYIKSNNSIFIAKEMFSPEYKNPEKNSINLKEEKERNMLIVGPSGAGKTDFLRTVIKTSLFSNIGIAPVKSLKITPFQFIEQNLSSVNISKNLSKGQIERKDISEFFENLNKTEKPVLICIDEIFSSVDTETSLFLIEEIFKNNLEKKNLISILNTHNPKHRILLNEKNSIKESFPFVEIKWDEENQKYIFKKKYKILNYKNQIENFWIPKKDDPNFEEKNKIKRAFIKFIIEEEDSKSKS